MGLALTPVHLSVIAELLHIPEGYHIAFVKHELGSPLMTLLIESPKIPDSPTAARLPYLDFLISVEYGPETCQSRKYTVEPKLREV